MAFIPPETPMLLILVDGILASAVKAQSYLKRTKKSTSHKMGGGHMLQTTERTILVIPLQFDYSRLNDPDIFRLVREILWLANVQFTDSFDKGIWKRDRDGLYNRGDAMRADLTQLSWLHNNVVDAIERYKREPGDGRQLLKQLVSRPSDQIVTTHHHRQIGDILSIIRLLQRDLPEAEVTGNEGIQNEFCTTLRELAEEKLDANDPRRRLLESLSELPQNQNWDPEGHFLVAFDTCCRHLWTARLDKDENDIKVLYSYNQASIPRAEVGKFYERFRGRKTEILTVLKQMDIALGQFRTETFCIWHTAIRSLLAEERYADAEETSSELVKRILEPEEFRPYIGQLNHDVATSFFLEGQARNKLAKQLRDLQYVQEGQEKQEQALGSLKTSFHMRRLSVPDNTWDPLLKYILRDLIATSKSLNYRKDSQFWSSELEKVCRVE